MAATGKAALQAGPAAPQKPCTLARPVHRASRLVARKPARVQAVAAPPREYTTAESLSLDDDAPTTTFTAGQSDSVDAAIAQEPRGRQEYRLPAPLDAVGDLWASYARRVETDPVPTKAMTSLFGFMLGDFLAQRIEGRPFNPIRCLRLGGYGLTIDGPIGHMWYKILDKYVFPKDPQCTAAVLLKTAADQIIWAPIMTCVYFAFLRSVEGHPELIMSTIQAKLFQTVVANYVLWPAAHFINFKFVPTQHRILYNNVVSIFWNAFLSTLSHAPTIEPENMMDAYQQFTESLPEPLHVRAAEFADALYSATRPLHEQAAQFSDALKLPLGGHELSHLKLPTTIKVAPTRVHPESNLFDNWDF